MNDSEIIDLYFGRNEAAVEKTKAKYGGYLKSIISKMINNYSDVEECENDTYLTLWNIIPPNKPDSLKYFAAKVSRNLALKFIEKMSAAKRSAITEVYEELEDSLIDNTAMPEDAYEATELAHYISEYLKTKTPIQKAIFIKRYWYYKEIKDIANETGASTSNVKTTLFRMRNELHNELKKHGYS